MLSVAAGSMFDLNGPGDAAGVRRANTTIRGMSADVLVVEDDQVIRETLQLALAAAGYDVSAVAAAGPALSAAVERPRNLVLLDLGLPDADGFMTCRRLRSVLPDAVIIVLTARHEELDVVAGLESGADDYLLKPFKIVELLARIRAHLRRSPPARDVPDIVQVGDLRVDPGARTVHLGATEVPLRNREFDLLARIATEPGTAISREALMADVWDEQWEGSTKTLDVHILSLRRKLADAATRDGRARPPVIVTLRGHGYRLEMPTPSPGGAGPFASAREGIRSAGAPTVW
jgi:DNA-binding response OmpR family regulator